MLARATQKGRGLRGLCARIHFWCEWSSARGCLKLLPYASLPSCKLSTSFVFSAALPLSLSLRLSVSVSVSLSLSLTLSSLLSLSFFLSLSTFCSLLLVSSFFFSWVLASPPSCPHILVFSSLFSRRFSAVQQCSCGRAVGRVLRRHMLARCTPPSHPAGQDFQLLGSNFGCKTLRLSNANLKCVNISIRFRIAAFDAAKYNPRAQIAMRSTASIDSAIGGV